MIPNSNTMDKAEVAEALDKWVQLDQSVSNFQMDNIELPVSLHLFQKYMANIKEIINQIIIEIADGDETRLATMRNDKNTYDRIVTNYYYSFYLQPKIRKQYQYRLKPCTLSLKNQLLMIPKLSNREMSNSNTKSSVKNYTKEEQQISTSRKESQLQENNKRELDLQTNNSSQKGRSPKKTVKIVLPVSFETFKRYVINHKEIVLDILKDYAKGDEVRFKKLQSDTKIIEQTTRRYYKSFYLNPQIRSLFRYCIKPCSKEIRNRILEIPASAETPKESVESLTKEIALQSKTNGEPINICSNEITEKLSAEEQPDQLSEPEIKRKRNEIDANPVSRIPDKNFAIVQSIPTEQEVISNNLNDFSKPQHGELKTGKPILPVTIDVFKSYIINYKEIVLEILKDSAQGNVEKFNKMKNDSKTLDKITLRYYKSFYLKPNIRNLFEYRIKPCSDRMKNRLLSVPTLNLKPKKVGNNNFSQPKNADNLSKECGKDDALIDKESESQHVEELLRHDSINKNIEAMPEQINFENVKEPVSSASVKTSNASKTECATAQDIIYDHNYTIDLENISNISADNQLPDNMPILAESGLLQHKFYEYPVTLEVFKKYIFNHEEIVSDIIRDYVKDDSDKFNAIKNNKTVCERIIMNYYHAFYYKPKIRPRYNYKIASCPLFLKKKILQIPNINIPHSSNDSEQNKREIEDVDNNQSDDSNNNSETVAPNKEDGKCVLPQDVLAAQNRIEQQNEPKNENEKILVHQQFYTYKWNKLMDQYLDSKNLTECQRSEVVRTINNSNKANIISVDIIPPTNVQSNLSSCNTPKEPAAKSDAVNNYVFTIPIAKIYKLPYLLRNSQGLKNRILRSVMKMSFQEFQLYTRIYNTNQIYENVEKIQKYFNVVLMTHQVWPTDLYMPLEKLQVFLHDHNLCFSSLQHISPKLLHWCDLIQHTNYDDCVKLDYFKRTAKQLEDEAQLTKEREHFYIRCWVYEQWIWRVPQLTSKVFMDKSNLKNVSTGNESTFNFLTLNQRIANFKNNTNSVEDHCDPTAKSATEELLSIDLNDAAVENLSYISTQACQNVVPTILKPAQQHDSNDTNGVKGCHEISSNLSTHSALQKSPQLFFPSSSEILHTESRSRGISEQLSSTINFIDMPNTQEQIASLSTEKSINQDPLQETMQHSDIQTDLVSGSQLIPSSEIKQETLGIKPLHNIYFILDSENSNDDYVCESFKETPIVVEDDDESFKLSRELQIFDATLESVDATMSMSENLNHIPLTQNETDYEFMFEGQRQSGELFESNTPDACDTKDTAIVSITNDVGKPLVTETVSKTNSNIILCTNVNTAARRNKTKKNKPIDYVPQLRHEFRALPLTAMVRFEADACPIPESVSTSNNNQAEKAISASQALTTDNTIFNSTELLQFVEQHGEEQNNAVINNPAAVINAVCTSASIVASTKSKYNQAQKNQHTQY